MSVTGHGGRYRFETLMLSQVQYSLPTGGGEVVSLTYQLPFTLWKIAGTHFC
jgi:hypothetical protein